VERVRVGLLAVTLLLARAGHSGADYIFVCQLPSPSSSDGQFPNSRSLTADSAEVVIVPDALNRRIHLLISSYAFLASFGEFGSGDGESPDAMSAFLPTLGNPVAGNWLKTPGRQFPDGGTFLGDFAGLTMGSLQFNGAFSLGISHTDANPVADTIDHGGEMSTGDYSFLARFGGPSLGETQAVEAFHVVLSPMASGPAAGRFSNPKLLFGLCLIALSMFGTLGYAWRQRKRRLRRFLRGPRRTTLYRSPNLPQPPGKTL
jgi:hypothetical protein